jgi:asparagine synthase (glutamine-hydrolysing)
MCGIAGLLAYRGSQDELAALAGSMNDAIAHRGPDDAGVEAGDGWALGMRRLAIIDLSANGHQPMRRGQHTLVFNGEVYNYRELRAELEAEGVPFVGASDTEVVLELLRRRGPAVLERLDGMFALVLVDEQRRTALVARDRWGKKPLFLARLRDGLAFASELKAIHAIAHDQLEVDRGALAAYFRYQYVPGGRCIYRGVEKLPAASWCEVDLTTGAVAPARRYWRLPEPDRVEASPGEVLATIREAVRCRLVSDRPLGAFLSGGTDSSLVVGAMTRVSSDVRTFSIGFEDPRFDESALARQVAAHFGTRHTSLTLSEADALALVPALGRTYDEPFADSSAIPTMAVAALARRDVVVALSGDGGDELFGGYRRYARARSLGAAAVLPRLLAPAIGAAGRLPRVGRRAASARLLAAAASPGDAYRERVSLWRSPDVGRLVPGVDGSDTFAARFDAEPGGPVERMMRTDATTYLTDAILQKVDRATMRVGLEARNPLLDPAVVAVGLASVAAAERSPGGKDLLRSALRTILPADLVDRPKKGFSIPVAAWLRGPLRPVVEDLVLARRATEYDSDVAHAVCREHLAGRVDHGSKVWALLAYELWRAEWAR